MSYNSTYQQQPPVTNYHGLNEKQYKQSLISQIQQSDLDISTVLHIAANTNNIQTITIYMKAYDQLIQRKPNRYSVEQRIKWLRTKDSEGFSCLHYAVYRGNFKIVTLLQQYGADIYQNNNQGLTVLHIAAQGNSPLLMHYFLRKGLKISVTDNKGNTPLHWACFNGMQSSAFALISWGAQIDKRQVNYGMTPLHLAVMSGNGRIVKKLLIKGCDRNIRAYNNKLPLDIAIENQYKSIAEMIIDKQGIQQLMNIKTPFRKMEKHYLPFYLFLFLLFSNYILNGCFAVHDIVKYQDVQSIVFLSIGFFVIVLFVACKYSDPGILRPYGVTEHQFFQILQRYKPSSICFDCKIVRPVRSRHCQICDSCICVYDHHCPWVANCIGANNYCIFFTFLLFLMLFMAYTIFFQLYNLVITHWNTQNAYDVIRVISQIYSLIVSIIFIIPLLFLIIVQARNMFQNKTTFQRYTTQASPDSSQTTSMVRDSQNIMTGNSEIKISLLQNQYSQFTLGAKMTKPNQFQPNAPYSQQTIYNNCCLVCFGNKNIIRYQKAI